MHQYVFMVSGILEHTCDQCVYCMHSRYGERVFSYLVSTVQLYRQQKDHKELGEWQLKTSQFCWCSSVGYRLS